MTTDERKAALSKDCMNTLRSQLYFVMSKTNCTQEKLAEVCGISLRSMCNILNTQQTQGVRLETLVSISVGTGIPLANLIDAKGQEMAKNIEIMEKLSISLEHLYTLMKDGVRK